MAWQTSALAARYACQHSAISRLSIIVPTFTEAANVQRVAMLSALGFKLLLDNARAETQLGRQPQYDVDITVEFSVA